ncbi:hypothetical protein [Butyrivibrio sp. NC3005]|uniref:hypothetical protein n=1 Tax=Butyrivibrio sp. NC3005 TaxID=1280685 RepID=UPI00041FC033|nr:hypothetical protein [Butyrivibrio sp. NC3005]
MADRNDLIGQLAAAMGAGDFAATQYEGSRYDRGTGTLYCNGHIISATTVQKAKKFYSTMMTKCDSTNPEGREMRSIYELALEGIKFMEDYAGASEEEKDGKK